MMKNEQAKYLHDLKDFTDLLYVLEKETGILAQLIEKDYWIMHVLYGLKEQGFEFELKGGTSLSKGYGIIDRFSEDIDIHIKPPQNLNVNTNPKNSKEKAIESRKKYYDWLAQEIRINGITSVERDTAFDNTVTYNSGGIRLVYKSKTSQKTGIKSGILLEAGFDTVTPNEGKIISSWALDKALNTSGISVIDNRAKDIACYHPGYTFVEKLQTIITKFRREQETGIMLPNLMRQYYDVYSLLNTSMVQEFIGTKDYIQHKNNRFSNKDKMVAIADNEAFLLSDPVKREQFKRRYEATKPLYYKKQPLFDDLLHTIRDSIKRL